MPYCMAISIIKTRIYRSLDSKRCLHTATKLLESPSFPQQLKTPDRRPVAKLRPQNDRISIWPFAAILVGGTGIYAYLVQIRQGTVPRPKGTLDPAQLPPNIKIKRQKSE